MHLTLTVTGMTCGHCEKAVTRAIQALDAHAHVVIDRAHDRVEVDTTRNAQQVADAIREEGYQVTH